MGKSDHEIQQIATETLEGHQRAIMGNMTVEVVMATEINTTVADVLDVTNQTFKFYCMKVLLVVGRHCKSSILHRN